MNYPEIHSRWQHTNGNTYRVPAITNAHATIQQKYPVTVPGPDETDPRLFMHHASKANSYLAAAMTDEIKAVISRYEVPPTLAKVVLLKITGDMK